MWRLLLFFAGALALAGCKRPPATVRGRALDAETLRPLSKVTIRWQDQAVVTGENGEYSFRLAPGVHEFRVTYAGTSFSRFVAVHDTLYEEHLCQTQDVLVPTDATRAPDPDAWLVGFRYAATGGTATESDPSGLLLADEHGNNGRFLSVGHAGVAHPRWDAKHSRIYFATLERDPGLFRYDTTLQTTSRVLCEGLASDPYVSMLCLSPDGESAILGTANRMFALRGLGSGQRCVAVPIPGLDARSDPGCAFATNTQAFVSTRVADENPSGVPRLRVITLDRQEVWVAPLTSEQAQTWALEHPVVLDNGDLLVQRTDSDDQETRRSTWLLPAQTGEPSLLSETPAPLDLTLGRLLYQSAGVRVRDLRTRREAVLFNAARGLDRISARTSASVQTSAPEEAAHQSQRMR